MCKRHFGTDLELYRTPETILLKQKFNAMSPTTAELKKQDIIDQLTWDNRVDANEVFVHVQGGVVQLKGKVPTYASKIAAEKDVYEVEGVNKVENYLEVEISPDFARPTDAGITRNIENKLVWNSEINSANINVQTTRGIVSLTGTVDSYWEKKLAEDIALYTSGVMEVINDLSVSVTKSVVDIDIEKDIKSTFKRSGLVNEDDITVNVTGGIVRLSGTLPNYAAKRQAYNIAMYTAGVVDVIDDIITA